MTESVFQNPQNNINTKSKQAPSPLGAHSLAAGAAAGSHRFQGGVPSTEATPQVWIRRLVWKIAIATLLLMAVGSATRVMNAGLACPDWPLCYGQLVPAQQMNLQVFLEWFHRLDAALIGFSAIALCGLSWWWRKELPSWIPYVATVALFSIVFQGILGALTVTQLLRFDIVTAHLAMALLFFCILIVIGASLTSDPAPPSGANASSFKSGNPPNGLARECAIPVSSNFTIPRSLGIYGSIAATLIYLQSLIGGLVASRWALHQCFGNSQLCTVMNSHIIGVVPPTLAIAFLCWRAYRTPNLTQNLKTLSIVAGSLVILQILLGIATFSLHLQVEPLTVTHQAVGATLLGVLVTFTVLAFRSSQSNKQYQTTAIKN